MLLNKKKKGKSTADILDKILVDAFAAAREGAFRALGMKPYKVQIRVVSHFTVEISLR